MAGCARDMQVSVPRVAVAAGAEGGCAGGCTDDEPSRVAARAQPESPALGGGEGGEQLFMRCFVLRAVGARASHDLPGTRPRDRSRGAKTAHAVPLQAKSAGAARAGHLRGKSCLMRESW